MSALARSVEVDDRASTFAPPIRAALRALRPHLGAAVPVSASSEPWASVTFSGDRVTLLLEADPRAARRFVAVAAELELAVAGRLVGDANAVLDAAGRVLVELLLIDAA